MIKAEKVLQQKISHTIQPQRKNGGLAKMIDNRPMIHTLDAIRPLLQRAAIVQSETQTFDATGKHISRGQTNPPKVVNTLNTYHEVIKDMSDTPYQNAHMMAATFGGANAADNMAAWNETMEDHWGEKENEIRNGDLTTLPEANETGTVTTNVNMPETWSAQTLGEEIYDTAASEIHKLTNWTPVPMGGGKVAPALLPTDIIAKDADFKTRVATRVNNDIGNAITKMPDQATISYNSTHRTTPRSLTTTFANQDEIAHPLVSTDAVKCAKFVSGLKVLGSVKAHNLNIP